MMPAPILVMRMSAVAVGIAAEPVTTGIWVMLPASTGTTLLATAHGTGTIALAGEPAERSEAPFLAFVEALVEWIESVRELL